MGVREIERFLGQWQMDARDLRQRMIRSPTPRERERWYALLLLAQGWTGSAIATTLERDPHTIGRWAAAFGEGGAGVCCRMGLTSAGFSVRVAFPAGTVLTNSMSIPSASKRPALVDSTSPRYGEKASYYSPVCLETGEVEWMELERNS